MHRHINGYVATLVHWAPASARLDDGGKMATLEKARNPSPPPLEIPLLQKSIHFR